MICQITRAGQYSLAWGEVSGKKHTSAYGTSATFTRRGLMSGSGPFSDISAWPAYVAE
jgi:hypothetical protein